MLLFLSPVARSNIFEIYKRKIALSEKTFQKFVEKFPQLFKMCYFCEFRINACKGIISHNTLKIIK